MHDALAAMVERGHRVMIYTARRGYGDTGQRYPAREVRDGVEIRRLPLASLGKGSMLTRLVGGLLFVTQVITRGLFVRDLAGVLVSTSPPMAPLVGLALRGLRRVPFVFWAMDINPDQIVAMGRLEANAWPVRLFERLIRATLRRAAHVVALDAFMSQRLTVKAELNDRVSILPPWPLEDHLAPVAHADNPFRREHGLTGKLVLMYSGNISPAHPVTTLLEAAKRLRDEPGIVFMFIGDGLARGGIERCIEREALENVRLLPYQPLDRLRLSLSAADVHLVVMGEAMVGIVHPSKLYGAMAVARPVLLVGPRRSHAGEIIDAHRIGWQVDHGEVDATVATIRRIAELAREDPAALTTMGERARRAIDTAYSKDALCAAFCDILERHLTRA